MKSIAGKGARMTTIMNCLDPANVPACFLAYDYAETKDLLKSALTLISGILVFSVTFGEKIVGFESRSRSALRLLVSSWLGLVAAFVLAGTALALMAVAAGEAIYLDYRPLQSNFEATASVAYLLTLLAGGSFVLSLLSMVVAAILAMSARNPSPANDRVGAGED